MKTDQHFYRLTYSSLLICDSRKLIDHWFFIRNDDICSSTSCSFVPLLSNRFFLTVKKGNDEERVRMNVTPAERRGFRAKTTSRTPLAWLLFLFVLFSSFLPYIPLLYPFFSFALASRSPRYTWRTTVLYVTLQDAFSRSSSPYPFSINATTSTAIYHFTWHQPGDTSVLVLEGRKSWVQSMR